MGDLAAAVLRERTAREVQVPQVTADCVRLSLLSYPQLEQLDQDALVSAESLTFGPDGSTQHVGGRVRGWCGGSAGGCQR